MNSQFEKHFVIEFGVKTKKKKKNSRKKNVFIQNSRVSEDAH